MLFVIEVFGYVVGGCEVDMGEGGRGADIQITRLIVEHKARP